MERQHSVKENLPPASQIDHQNGGPLIWLFAIAGLTIAGLHLYAGFFPTALNWGVHLLGFLPTLIKLLVPLLMIAIAIPRIQGLLLQAVQELIRAVQRNSRIIRVALLVSILAGSVLLFWIARERTFFLGDGNVLVRTLPNISTIEDIPRAYKNEPLAGTLMWYAYRLLNSWMILPSEEIAVHVVSIVFGVGSIVLLVSLSRRIATGTVDQALTYALLVATAGSQLFFGYVENYSPLYCTFILYVVLALSYLKGKIHLVVPAIVFGVLFAFHFGMLSMIPSVLFLFYRELRRGHPFAVLYSAAAMLVTSALLLWACGYSPATFADVLFRSDKHLIAMFRITSDWQAYTAFSLFHILDLVNLHLLIAPFSLFMLAAMAFRQPRIFSFRDNRTAFLMIAAGCGLLFTFEVNSDIGMSADWDLLVTFCLPVVIASVALWNHLTLDQKLKRGLLIMMAGITFLHTLVFILVNADADRALARFSHLQDLRLWAPHAFGGASEGLGIYYRTHGNYQQALECYQKYIEFDSTNSRVWGSIAYVHQLMGDHDGELSCDEKALQYGNASWQVYLNLGSLYSARGQTEQAIVMTRKALELNPGSAIASNNLGSSIIKRNKAYLEALPYFLQAIAIDSTYASPYFNAGLCEFYLGKYKEMRFYFETYLRLRPDAPERNTILTRMAAYR